MVLHQAPYLVPCLFLLCIDDIPKSISDTSNPILFANDTSMTIKGSDSHESLNKIKNCIIDINSWFISNMLYLNTDKTQYSFSNKK